MEGPDQGRLSVKTPTRLVALLGVYLAISWYAPAAILAPYAVLPTIFSPFEVVLVRAFLLGTIASQMTLVAIWLAFGSDAWPRRLLSCCALTVALFFAALLGSQVRGDEVAIEHSPIEVLRGGILFVTGIAILQIPFSLVRSFWPGWQLQAPWHERDPSTGRQFPLRFLLGLIAGLAFALSLGRLLIPSDAWHDPVFLISPVLRQVPSWMLLQVGSLLVVLPCLRAAWVERPAPWLIAIPLVAIPLAVGASPRSIGSIRWWTASMFMFHAAQGLSIFICFRLLRYVGFCLEASSGGPRRPFQTRPL